MVNNTLFVTCECWPTTVFLFLDLLTSHVLAVPYGESFNDWSLSKSINPVPLILRFYLRANPWVVCFARDQNARNICTLIQIKVVHEICYLRKRLTNHFSTLLFAETWHTGWDKTSLSNSHRYIWCSFERIYQLRLWTSGERLSWKIKTLRCLLSSLFKHNMYA